MDNREIGLRTFDRSNLPSLLQGERPLERSRLLDWLHREDSSGKLTAVWSLDEMGDHAFLPNLLIGTDAALADALAWSGAFLNGLGPLSGLMRTMSLAEARMTLSERRQTLPFEQIGRLVACVVGEVLARQGERASENSVTLTAACNTLSFALFRGALVAPFLGEDEIVRRWTAIFGNQSDIKSARIDAQVIEIYQNLSIVSGLNLNNYGRKRHVRPTEFEFQQELKFESLQDSIAPALVKFFPTSFWSDAEKLGPEALLGVVDDALPKILRMSRIPERDRAALIAKLSSLVTQDLSNQLELIRPTFSDLPEICVWIGYYYSTNAPGKVLALNGGLGWKIAMRLVNQLNVFDRPNCDIGWRELDLSSDTDARSDSRHRIVELFSGHNVVRASAAKAHSDPGPRESRPRSRSRVQSEADVLSFTQKHLEEALAALRMLQKNRY